MEKVVPDLQTDKKWSMRRKGSQESLPGLTGATKGMGMWLTAGQETLGGCSGFGHTRFEMSMKHPHGEVE